MSTTHVFKSALKLNGVFPPITTPFNKDGSIAYDHLDANVNKWNEIPFAGYVVLGSTGESVLLTPDERVEVVKRVKKSADKNKLVIGGAGYEGTNDTIEMAKRMADAGADALMVVTPNYFRGQMSTAALKSHYTKVADNSPVPIILYSVPQCTAFELSAEAVLALADHPNIIGMKDSGGDIIKITRILNETEGKDFQLLAGSTTFFLPALLLGAVGTICACANVLGKEICEMYELFVQGKTKEAVQLQRKLYEPTTALFNGVPGVKAAMEWRGYYGGPPRLPLLPLTEEENNKTKQVFIKYGFVTK